MKKTEGGQPRLNLGKIPSTYASSLKKHELHNSLDPSRDFAFATGNGSTCKHKSSSENKIRYLGQEVVCAALKIIYGNESTRLVSVSLVHLGRRLKIFLAHS